MLPAEADSTSKEIPNMALIKEKAKQSAKKEVIFFIIIKNAFNILFSHLPLEYMNDQNFQKEVKKFCDFFSNQA